MPIIAYMVGADFLANGVAAQVETLKKEVEIAATLGAHRMRHDATGGKDATGKAYTWEEALPILAEGYGRVTEYAMGLGINTMIENHGYFRAGRGAREIADRGRGQPQFRLAGGHGQLHVRG